MNKDDNKMPKWKDMVAYEKVLLVLEFIVGVADVAVSIFYKFTIPGVSTLLLAVVLLLNGGVYIRTKKKMAYLWLGLGVLDILLAIFNFMG